MKRTRYQFGSLELRGNVWSFRHRESGPDGKRLKKRVRVGTTAQYPTEADALRAVEALRLKVNQESRHDQDICFGALIDRFIDDEQLLVIAAQRPGETHSPGLLYSTARSYLSVLNGQIRGHWSMTPLSKMRPLLIHNWLRKLDIAPKTKAHIKALMHRLFEKAMLWELFPVSRNPMELVQVKGISKRIRKPLILTPDQFYALVDLLPDPYKTMVMVAQCLGLRISEVLVLKWGDIDFDHLVVRVTRAVVHGRIERVKTECSQDELPLDPDFANLLLEWRTQCPKTPEGWVFPSHISGQPYHASPIQQDYLRPAGERLGLGRVGWHTFRHTYRSWLDATGAPTGVQQKLMRHAQVSTTMNVYGDALMESKREANSKVVSMVLRPQRDPQLILSIYGSR